MNIRPAAVLIGLLSLLLPRAGAAALLPTSIEVGDGIVVRTVLVQESGPWEVVDDVPWISTKPAGGHGNHNLEVLVARNTTGEDRQASITIAGEQLTVTQRTAGSGLRELWAVGDNGAGQLGDSRVLFRTTPIPIATQVQAVGAGSSFSLILKGDGTLWAVGDNSYGQLGDGTILTRKDEPVLIASGVASAAAGKSHAMFVKTDRTLWAMGSDDQGQLGNGFEPLTLAPQLVAADVLKVATGGYHTLFLKADGTLWAMGNNSFGQVYPPAFPSNGFDSPVQVASDVTELAAGEFHSVFVKTDGTLWTMGSDDHGQLGDAPFSGGQPAVQVASDVLSIAAGATHTLFIRADRTLCAMGDNSAGQLGDGTTTQRDTPVQVATEVVSVTAGDRHSAFVKADGTLWAMGDNSKGQLGVDGVASSSLPIMVASSVDRAVAGGNHTFMFKSDGSLWAFGSNLDSQLGDRTVTQRNSAVEVGTGVARIAAGYYHTLLVKPDGTLWSTEDNNPSQPGVGSTGGSASTFVQVATGVSSANGAIAGGRFHSLFVKTDGTLWGMGDNTWTQLGVADSDFKETPVQIATGVASAAAGWEHSLFVKTDGTLWTMGWNDWGQLGDGTTLPRSSPVQVATGVAFAAAGDSCSVFLKTDGTLWAMGRNSAGQLGDGTRTTRLTPVQVANSVAAVAMGRRHTLFVKTDGSLWSTGTNDFGQLGDGTSMTFRETPIQVAEGVVSVAAGMWHSLFTKTDGSLWAMGWNEWGQLGDGTTVQRNSPVKIATGVISISAGRAHTVFTASGSTGDVPAIVLHPSSRTIEAGQDISLDVTASGIGSPQYQWFKNGAAIPGANAPTFNISAAQTSNSGVYSVAVTNTFGSVTSFAFTITVAAGPPPPLGPRLINVSARAFAGSGDNTLIVGFYISGSSAKTLLIRGIGPQLALSNVPLVVADPAIRLYRGNTPLIENDNWDAALATDFNAVGAFELPTGSKDSAMKVTLSPGAYTVHLINPGAVAEALVEVYDLSRDSDSRLSNLSCRLNIKPGQTVIMGTYLLGGSIPILARNIGPELVTHGLPPLSILPDPQLRIYTGQTDVAFNDDWENSTGAYFGPVGAFPLVPGSKDAALRVTLAPGAHTVHATGVGSGVALIELYESN